MKRLIITMYISLGLACGIFAVGWSDIQKGDVDLKLEYIDVKPWLGNFRIIINRSTKSPYNKLEYLEGFFLDGEFHGTLTYYNKNKDLEISEKWARGNLISEELIDSKNKNIPDYLWMLKP